MAPLLCRSFYAAYSLLLCLRKPAFSYGAQLPVAVRHILTEYDKHMDNERTPRDNTKLVVQALVGICWC